MRHRNLALLCAALIATGCSKPAPSAPAPAPAPAVTAQPQMPAPVAPAPAPKADNAAEVAKLNDLALTLVREHFPAEGAAAAQKAIALDENNSAAWFNLGRAYLDLGRFGDARIAFGRASQLTGGKNADVEYFEGQVELLAGEYGSAITLFERALKSFPGDKEIAQALSDAHSMDQTISAGEFPATLPADVDGDALPDTVEITEAHLRITAATGKVLVDEDLPGPAWFFHLYPIEGATPLMHLEYHGCPNQPLNYFMQWDTKNGRALTEDINPCMSYRHEGNGRLKASYRAMPFYFLTEQIWQHGRFVAGKGGGRYIEGSMVRYDNLAYVLTGVAEGGLANPSELFATSDLYRLFREKTGTRAWTFEQTPWKDQSGTIIRAFQDGRKNGGWHVGLTNGQITLLQWREEGTIADGP